MARKPQSEWSEAYRKRIERAEASGKTRQQARGHKVREHVIRKERETKREAVGLGLSTDHKAKVRKYLRGLNNPKAISSENIQKTYGAVLMHGWPWFEKVRQTRAAFVRQKRTQSMPTGAGYWDYMVEELDLDDNDLDFLLYYHD